MNTTHTTGLLGSLALALMTGRIRIVDLTQTLSPDFPAIALPPEMGQCQPFRIEQVSAYDERGPGWYWNNFSCGEHTGTHFDAPIHWISGRDLPNNSVDTIPAQHFMAPACVIDCSAQSADDPDYLMTVADIEAFAAARALAGAPIPVAAAIAGHAPAGDRSTPSVRAPSRRRPSRALVGRQPPRPRWRASA